MLGCVREVTFSSNYHEFREIEVRDMGVFLHFIPQKMLKKEVNVSLLREQTASFNDVIVHLWVMARRLKHSNSLLL